MAWVSGPFYVSPCLQQGGKEREGKGRRSENDMCAHLLKESIAMVTVSKRVSAVAAVELGHDLF